MPKKITYRVRNWKKYNRSLINRGNLTLWFSEDVIESWYEEPQQNKGRGRPCIYSDRYVELALTLRTLFRFSLRATQGFLEGLVSLLGIELKVSHYSCLSRRAPELELRLHKFTKAQKMPVDLVIDSTGLKIYGEGEWKMRTHGKQKRRGWRKYHVTVNPDSHEVTAVELTNSNVHDGDILPALITKQKNIRRIYGDGAYTFRKDFDAIAGIGAVPIISMLSGACLVKKEPSAGDVLRNRLIKEIRDAGGNYLWKRTSGYHRRSLAETHMSRLKSILGGSLRARNFANQKTEAVLMANILNKMTALGMPISVAVPRKS